MDPPLHYINWRSAKIFWKTIRETNVHLYLSKMDENFIAIKFEVIGVNFVACVSCQNGSGSLWLKLIGLSQTQSGIKALLSCNKKISDQFRKRVFSRRDNDCLMSTVWRGQERPGAHVTNARKGNTRHQPPLTISNAATICNSRNPNLFSATFWPSAVCVVCN